MTGDVDLVKFLIKSGVDCNVVGRNGTPLDLCSNLEIDNKDQLIKLLTSMYFCFPAKIYL